jgi:hypothetical protein
MPETKAKDLDAGPYPQSVVVRRIEALAAKREKGEGKQIAGLLDAAPNWWTRRKKGTTAITVPEVSVIAAKLGAPPGWPWLDEHHIQALAVGLAELARRSAEGSSPRLPASASPGRRLRRKGWAR